MAAAVSKQEIRRNALAEWVVAAVQFVRRRWQMVLAALMGIVVLVAAWTAYSWYRGRREAEARKVVADADLALRGDSSGTPPKTEEAAKLLQQVADNYKGTASAEEALVRLGNLHYAGAKHDQAAEAYGRYLADYPRGRFVLMAAIGRAYALEAKGDLDGATRALSEAVDRQKSNPLAGEAYTTLGRLYEAQKRFFRFMRSDAIAPFWTRAGTVNF
ncbi:MAG: tol-pal system YbgF family protein [Candidatus Methylomirabilales bacterium]